MHIGSACQCSNRRRQAPHPERILQPFGSRKKMPAAAAPSRIEGNPDKTFAYLSKLLETETAIIRSKPAHARFSDNLCPGCLCCRRRPRTAHSASAASPVSSASMTIIPRLLADCPVRRLPRSSSFSATAAVPLPSPFPWNSAARPKFKTAERKAMTNCEVN